MFFLLAFFVIETRVLRVPVCVALDIITHLTFVMSIRFVLAEKAQVCVLKAPVSTP